MVRGGTWQGRMQLRATGPFATGFWEGEKKGGGRKDAGGATERGDEQGVWSLGTRLGEWQERIKSWGARGRSV